MKTILVTGCAGFIGSAVSHHLLERGDRVVGVDDFNDYYDPGLKEARIGHFCDHKKFRLHRADIRDHKAMKAVFAEHQLDQVCHLAARAGVRASLEQPLLYTDVNVRGTHMLLELAKECDVGDFIFASSSSVYGNVKTSPFSENLQLDTPISPYAATKKATELMAHSYHHHYDMNCTALRYFTVYGPWGRPDMSLFLFTKAILDGTPIDVYNYGRMKRDFTYIDDIVHGTVAALDAHYPYEVFNLGNSRSEDLTRFISLIEKALKRTAEQRLLPIMAGDVPATHADITKAQRMLGFTPSTTIDVGIPEFVAWYQEYNRQ